MRAGVRRVRDWLMGGVRGEVSPSGLDGLRQVGTSAYPLADEAEQLRSATGWDPWQQERATQLFLVCAWNAFALETTADHLLELDAAPGSSRTERVSETTLAFAQSCLAQVESWMQAARFAQANAAYRVSTPLPATLPSWPKFEETRREHIRELRAAYEAVAPRAKYELKRLEQTAASQQADELAEMNVIAAQMRTSLEFAEGLNSHARSHQQLQEVSGHLVRALGCAYTLGQLVAMPSLTERLRLAGYRAHGSSTPPLTVIDAGWPVMDRDGTLIGRVIRLEGETALGSVTGLVISVGGFSARRRARIDQIRTAEAGVVRLSVAKDALERV